MKTLSLMLIILFATTNAVAQSESEVHFAGQNFIKIRHYHEGRRNLVKYADCQLASEGGAPVCKDLALMTETQYKLMEACDMGMGIAGMIGFGVGGLGGILAAPFSWGLSLVPGVAFAAYSIHSFNYAEEQDNVYFFVREPGGHHLWITHDKFVEILRQSLTHSLAYCHVRGQIL